MKKIVPVAIAIIYNKKTNKYLMTQRKEIDRDDVDYGHCWNFPGGGIQWGEDPKVALTREINEELNVEINILTLIPRIFSPIRNNWHGLLICYLCEMKDIDAPIVLNHESMDHGWFSLEEIKKLKTLPLAYDVAIEAERCARGGSRTLTTCVTRF
ncbi:NUDIX hydrolase [Candidatus Roizmanbacteria bacterium]|nr:NUDIX hydrolase [Candidatus Roizmanbacteria bacterium]